MAGSLHQPLPAPALGVKKWHVPAPEEGTPVAQLQALSGPEQRVPARPNSPCQM